MSRLILRPGASFGGDVVAHANFGSVLELAHLIHRIGRTRLYYA
jgi:hypothetical protein